jgi:hypothetical protein
MLHRNSDLMYSKKSKSETAISIKRPIGPLHESGITHNTEILRTFLHRLS